MMTPLPAIFDFHHVGIGVLDFDAGIAAYRSLGYTPVVVADDERLGVRVAFLAAPQSPGHLVELLAPLGAASPLGSLIRRKLLPSPYHTCYAVEDHQAADRALADRGFARITEPTPARAMGGAPVAFYYHGAIGLIETVVAPPFPAGDQVPAVKHGRASPASDDNG